MNAALYYIVKVELGESISPEDEAEIDRDMSSFAKGMEVSSPLAEQVTLTKLSDQQVQVALAQNPVFVDVTGQEDAFEVDIRYGLDEEIISVTDPNSNKQLAIDEDEMLENNPVALSIYVFYPRADRFGVPSAATDEGASKMLHRLGFAIASTLDVKCKETGDDSGMEFVVKALVSPHCVAVAG